MGNELRINILVIEQNKDPTIGRIWNDLIKMRELVGTEELEVVEYKDILIIFNDNGLKHNIPINRYLDNLAVRGTFLIAGNNMNERDFQSLTDEQVKEYTEKFQLEREEELEV